MESVFWSLSTSEWCGGDESRDVAGQWSVWGGINGWPV